MGILDICSDCDHFLSLLLLLSLLTVRPRRCWDDWWCLRCSTCQKTRAIPIKNMVPVTRKAQNSLLLMSYLKKNSFRQKITSHLLAPQSVVKALKDMGSAEQMRCLLRFSPPSCTLASKVWVKRSLVLLQLCSGWSG